MSDVLIDVHIHLYQTVEQGEQMKQDFVVWEYGETSIVEYRSGPGDIEDTLRAMDEVGVSHSVAVNTFATIVDGDELVEEHPRDLRGSQVVLGETTGRDRLVSYNEWLCDLAATTERIIPFIAVDPWVMSPRESGEHVHAMAARGARGVKLHPAYSRFHAADRRVWPIYEACEELGLPMLSHSGAHAEHYAEPDAFAEALEDFPELTLILAHLGGAAWRQTAAFAERFPQVLFDCSEFISRVESGWPEGPSWDETAQMMRAVGCERIMMGSDFPWYRVDDVIARIRALPLLDEDEKRAILGLNAARLLGIDVHAAR
jgi:predicted TIM-barrel fold metal-dependent hydrolase